MVTAKAYPPLGGFAQPQLFTPIWLLAEMKRVTCKAENACAHRKKKKCVDSSEYFVFEKKSFFLLFEKTSNPPNCLLMPQQRQNCCVPNVLFHPGFNHTVPLQTPQDDKFQIAYTKTQASSVSTSHSLPY